MNFCSGCGLELSACVQESDFPTTPEGREAKIQCYLRAARTGVRRREPQDPHLRGSFQALAWLSQEWLTLVGGVI